MKFVKHDKSTCPHCHLLQLAADIERLHKAESVASERRVQAASKLKELTNLCSEAMEGE